MNQLDSIAGRIREQHNIALASARKTVEAMIHCGTLLREAQTKCAHGEWKKFLISVEISDRTCRRYWDLVEASKDAEKHGLILENGVTMIDVFRAYGIVKEHEPGGYKNKAYEDRKAIARSNRLGQVEFHFDEQYVPVIRGLIHSSKVEALGEATLRIIERDMILGLERVRGLLARRTTIDLDATPAPEVLQP